MERLVECVPNFSEGRDSGIIKQITDLIVATEGVKLLNVDPGKATNRTVVTFVGSPEAVIEAAFLAIKKASEVIDMSKHQGEHPRMGATDVCPLIPISGISMEETAEYANRLAQRVGDELKIPVYLYEHAQKNAARKNLSIIREGEYEGFFKKIKLTEWKPDYGPDVFPAKSGATVIGAREFLVAYNVNLNTTSVKRANSVAFDVREAGRKIKNEKGEDIIQRGACKSVKGIGWYIEEYGIAQVSMNLTNIDVTPVHIAFEECRKSAQSRGMRVTGSELVGLIPLKALTDAGKYYLEKQKRSAGVSEKELIKIAIKSLGLDELSPFKPEERIIEYMTHPYAPLINMTLKGFTDETASESPAPGGGSVSAYLGSLGISLATMVANLSATKKGWEDKIGDFSRYAEQGQQIKDELNKLVDKDTDAFNKVMAAMKLPKATDEEKKVRTEKIQQATKEAVEVPLRVMELSASSFDVIKAMAEQGNPNSASDAGVAALCAKAAVEGAFLNVLINLPSIKDESYKTQTLAKANKIKSSASTLEIEVLTKVNQIITNNTK